MELGVGHLDYLRAKPLNGPCQKGYTRIFFANPRNFSGPHLNINGGASCF
jgi:hypothetical protein